MLDGIRHHSGCEHKVQARRQKERRNGRKIGVILVHEAQIGRICCGSADLEFFEGSLDNWEMLHEYSR